MTYRTLLAVAGVATLLTLGGCATNRVSADAVRFHNGFAVQQGQTIAIRPVDAALAGSLEFSAYANLAGERLGRLGLRPAPSGPSDLVAELAYAQTTRDTSVDGGGRSPVSVGIGVGGGSGTFGLGGGVNFPLGSRESKNRGVRDTMVSLRIKRSGEEQIVWEGRATAETLNVEANTLTGLMPVMLDALFENFPGESGKTVHFTPPKSKR